MSIYKVPVYWAMAGTITIEADSVIEALDLAEENIDDFPLPEDGEYLEDSFEIGDCAWEVCSA